MATFLLTTDPNCSRKKMLMKKTAILLCVLFLLLSKTFPQEDSTQSLPDILPLQVVSIDATIISQNIQLTWKVNGNEEARSFEVERADDGGEFKKIGGRLSLGQAGTTAYEFVDALPKKNITFSYRVKILARDGSSVYSDLRAVKINDEIISTECNMTTVS